MTAHRERTLEMANAFLADVRRDLEAAAVDASDLPPRIRTMHTRVGHATPEYRTLAIPLPPGLPASPEVLSSLIARYVCQKRPCSVILALDAVAHGADGEPCAVLIAEARDCWGSRLFLMQPFRVADGRLAWEEPTEGGWRDPGEEEMILDAAFAEPEVVVAEVAAAERAELAPDPVAG